MRNAILRNELLILLLHCNFILTLQLLFLNRPLAVAFAHLDTQVSNVKALVLQDALVGIVPTSATVPPRHLLAVTHSMARATANPVSQGHSVMSLALLTDGVQTVRNLVLVLTDRATPYLETALVIEDGRGCCATNHAPIVATRAQDVTIATDRAIKPPGSACALQVTKEVHAWSLAVLVTMVISVKGDVIVLTAHFAIT